MSGVFQSTGKMTNNGENILDISNLLHLRIISLDIYSIPLSTGFFGTAIRGLGKLFQPFFHPAISPTFCHIAVKLNLENLKDIIIIEYGQYITDSSLEYLKNQKYFFDISNNRIELNKQKYYYINQKDGVRITKIEYNGEKNEIKTNDFIACTIAMSAGVYFSKIASYILDRNFFLQIINDFKIFKCDVKNKITLEELNKEFLGEKWEAKKYNLSSHNCQDFAAEVVKILKAVRINEKDKIRINEKALPNCLINALTNNEESFTINTLGRIPVFGLLFDVLVANKLVKK